MGLIDGLQGYEVVMLGLGVILFLVLVFVLLYQVLHGKSVATLFLSFVIPIVMVGYPSIQKVKIDGRTLSIEKTTHDLQSTPADPGLRQKLQQQVVQVEDTPFSSAKSLTVLAKAQYALGHDQIAIVDLRKALQADPNAPDARELQHRVTLVENIKRLASKVVSNPADADVRKELSKTLATTSQLPTANPNALTQIAVAQTALGEHQKALDTVSIVEAIRPNSRDTLDLKKSISKQIGSAASLNATPH